MPRLLVVLQVLDFQALEEFERKASMIMADHKGKILCAFETVRNEDGSGEEVHIVEFQREENIIGYRSDARHRELQELREKAISNTEIKVGVIDKSYSYQV